MVMGAEATHKLRRPVAKRWVQKRTWRAGMSIAKTRRTAEARWTRTRAGHSAAELCVHPAQMIPARRGQRAAARPASAVATPAALRRAPSPRQAPARREYLALLGRVGAPVR